MNGPNIFKYATKELRQDAFICWLLEWIDYDPDSYGANAARDFIVSLYNSSRQTSLFPDAIGIPKIIPQKMQNIDIYLEVPIKGHEIPVPFIIENKVWTSPHDDQLERYKKRVVDNGENPVCVLFKTGYHFHELDIKKANINKYVVINAAWMMELLERHPCEHPFYQDYIVYLKKEFVEPFEQAPAKVLGNRGHEHLKVGYKQYILMERLTIGMARFIRGDWNKGVVPGKNVGGTPWTQYRFLHLNKVYGDKAESLFYRIDYRAKKRKGGRSPYLRISHYANYKNVPGAKELKATRRKTFIAIFVDAFQRVGSPLKLGKISTQDGYESEVAIFFLDEAENCIPNLLIHLPEIHREFMADIDKTFLGAK